MSLTAFDVVIVPFPYSDVLAEKRRPALVVSTGEAMRRTGLVWVAMITTAPRAAFADAPIAQFEDAGLPVASHVRASKIATLDLARVIRRAGALSRSDRDRAIAALRSCAGF